MIRKSEIIVGTINMHATSDKISDIIKHYGLKHIANCAYCFGSQFSSFFFNSLNVQLSIFPWTKISWSNSGGYYRKTYFERSGLSFALFFFSGVCITNSCIYLFITPLWYGLSLKIDCFYILHSFSIFIPA